MLTAALGVVTLVTSGMAILVYRSISPEVQERWKLTIFRLCFGCGFFLSVVGSKLGFGEQIPLLRHFLHGMLSKFCPRVSPQQVQRHEDVFNGVRVRIYRPVKERDALRAGLVFFHGGGWIMGSIESHDGLAAYFALKADIVVVSVGYRLAPEHPFPAPLEDCQTATQYFIRNAGEFGVDGHRVAVGGDSAGGNLAAAVSLQLREMNFLPMPKAQVLIYPFLQVVDFGTPSYFRLRHYTNPRMFAWMSRLYLGLGEEYMDIMGNNKQMSPRVWGKIAPCMNVELLPKEYVPRDFKRTDPNNYDSRVTESVEQKLINPLVSPLLADDVTNLPTTFVFTAGTDVLRDDGALYAKRLTNAGVKVRWLDLPGGFHGCVTMTGTFLRVKSGQKVVDEVVGFLTKTL